MQIILALLLSFSQTLFARTIFEPSVSLNNGGFSGDFTGGDSVAAGTPVSLNYTTLGAGLRYGITREYIHVTAVLEGHAIMSSNNVNVSSDLSFVPNVGLGIGYEWNIPLRTYVVIGSPFSSLELSYFFSEKFLIGAKFSQMNLRFDGTEVAFNAIGVSVNLPIEFDYPSYWWRKRDWE